MPVETLNQFLSSGALFGQVAIVALLVGYFFLPKEHALRTYIAKYGLLVSFFIALVSAGLTLFYSEVVGYLPCGLCWFQRIFLYPQVVILGMALWKGDTRVTDYLIGLSSFGLVVALYQYYLQMGGEALFDCPAVTAGADCARRYIFEFGYITFPFMSAVGFALLISIMLFVRKSQS